MSRGGQAMVRDALRRVVGERATGSANFTTFFSILTKPPPAVAEAVPQLENTAIGGGWEAFAAAPTRAAQEAAVRDNAPGIAGWLLLPLYTYLSAGADTVVPGDFEATSAKLAASQRTFCQWGLKVDAPGVARAGLGGVARLAAAACAGAAGRRISSPLANLTSCGVDDFGAANLRGAGNASLSTWVSRGGTQQGHAAGRGMRLCALCSQRTAAGAAGGPREKPAPRLPGVSRTVALPPPPRQRPRQPNAAHAPPPCRPITTTAHASGARCGLEEISTPGCRP